MEKAGIERRRTVCNINIARKELEARTGKKAVTSINAKTALQLKEGNNKKTKRGSNAPKHHISQLPPPKAVGFQVRQNKVQIKTT